MKIKAELTWSSPQRALLGESPLWDSADGTLYWIDAADPAVYRLSGTDVRKYAMPKPVASIFLSRPGVLIVALRRKFAELHLNDGSLYPLDGVILPSDDERFNDGRCDRDGKLWISTMDRKLTRDLGTLVSMDAEGEQRVIHTFASLGNGTCFSPDNSLLYFSDTKRRTIFCYPLTDGVARAEDRRVFAHLGDGPGRPDGCSVDVEGYLWSARVGGGRIDRYAPDGTLVGYLETCVSHPTHCVFGGKDLKTLYVTSLRYPENDPQFADQEKAGAVLAYGVDVAGLPEGRFHPLNSAFAQPEVSE